MSVGILIPVFNDWTALAQLLDGLDDIVPSTGLNVSVLIVDDGSTEPPPASLGCRTSRLDRICLLPLKANVGHQRAIAAGLVEISEQGHEAIIVMDGDGEDRPKDVLALLDRYQARPGHIIAARRGKRAQSVIFKLFYRAYKVFFRLLTGERISFGNFMLIPGAILERIISSPFTPGNLAAAALRSRVPIDEVPTDRGERYAGRSRMRFSRLVAHGLTAISVYAEQVAARILLAGFTLMMLCIVGAATIVAIRMFTSWAVPGWATYTVVGMFIIFLQTAILCLMVTLNYPVTKIDSYSLHASLVREPRALK